MAILHLSIIRSMKPCSSIDEVTYYTSGGNVSACGVELI